MQSHTELYNILGVPTNATQNEIKKAFQQKARELHPDKNKSDPNATQKFQELNQAYDILKDPQKRSQYDQFGQDDDQSNIQDFDSIFEHFGFGRFGEFGNVYGNYRKTTEDIIYDLKLTLEEFYNGCSKKVRIKRQRICDTCRGKGLKKGSKSVKCKKCDGKGRIVNIQRLANNSILQQMVNCDECDGTGQFIPPDAKCPKCQGRGSVDNVKEFRIVIGRGMKNGEELVYKGESDEIPGCDPGDVIIRILEKKHKYFKRVGCDLYYEKEIEMSQSLLGFEFPVVHLDGRVLLFSSFHLDKHEQVNDNQINSDNQPTERQFDIDNLLENENSINDDVNHPKNFAYHNILRDDYAIIEDQQVVIIKGEGMSKSGNPFEKGNLHIKFHVNFPSSQDFLTKEFVDELLNILPIEDPMESINPEDENVYEVTVEDSTIEEFMNSKPSHQYRDEAYMSHENESDYDEQEGCLVI